MKRKAEGIALLSLYNDEDEDDDGEEEEGKEAAAIVDYAHDEATEVEAAELGVSKEEGEEEAGGATATAVAPPDPNSFPPEHRQQVTPQQEELVCLDESLVADFLPSPPTCKCSDELQDKFTWFLSLKDAGRSFNDELRNSKGYRNPDFLHRAVIHQGVDQLGSCFKKEIFDPHGYDPEDFYDALALEQKREFDRRDMERKQNQKLEFVRANTLAAAAKMMQQKVNVNASIPSLNEAAAAAAPKPESRTNKKSKWDKVEPDSRSIGGASLSSQNALAAALVSANAAALNFAQAAQAIQGVQQHKRKDEDRHGKNLR
ncbi:hypothetical protein SELMODRAFT_446839 [Selaginella moellendorffii]|uniref:SAP30-binding protein n=1 Tax=Selaginella moellendorffii TaxID=88036 RepID=D8SUS5_SELML|nr:SAP30-binding protein [Selaginella moellendorffii]EFJ11890.1 hypothetical protein SELMODRAFT_446839 [Selaginella moellendorffii]|eukprot:XP_024516613.1 SAP30-binding protein [Selaginella moellendorffii]